MAIRLDALTREELIELAASGCAADAQIALRADALIAQRKPLPSWCVDGVLLSADLLPHLFNSLSLRDCAVAAACSMWAAEWAAKLRREGYIDPEATRRIELNAKPKGVAKMPDGSLCVADDRSNRLLLLTDDYKVVRRVQPWRSLRSLQLQYPCGLLQHENSLFVVVAEVPAHVRRLRMIDGAELVRSVGLECPIELTMAGNLLFVPTSTWISVLDIDTLELRKTFGEFGNPTDCATCNDELYVADMDTRGMLEVYSFDGEHRRTVEGDFGRPISFCIRNDRIYLVEDTNGDDDDSSATDDDPTGCEGRQLLVLDLEGNILQEIRLDGDVGDEKSVRFCGDELVISDQDMERLHVMRLFTSGESGSRASPPGPSHATRRPGKRLGTRASFV